MEHLVTQIHRSMQCFQLRLRPPRTLSFHFFYLKHVCHKNILTHLAHWFSNGFDRLLMDTAGRQGSSPTCVRTDTEELRGSHPVLLGGLFRFPFPHVHAAESPSTQTNISLPQHIDKPEFPDTGWDRIKDVFFRRWVPLICSCFMCVMHRQ